METEIYKEDRQAKRIRAQPPKPETLLQMMDCEKPGDAPVVATVGTVDICVVIDSKEDGLLAMELHQCRENVKYEFELFTHAVIFGTPKLEPDALENVLVYTHAVLT